MTVMQGEVKVTKNPVRARVIAVSKDGKTARVEIPTVVANKAYGKRLHRVTILSVDTAKKSIKEGIMVSVLPCRRMSKTKSWKVVEIISA